MFATIGHGMGPMVLDDGFLYWTSLGEDFVDNDSNVARIALGSGSLSVLLDRLPGPISLTIVGDTLYWADRLGAIQSMPTSGSATPDLVYQDTFGPTYVASDGQFLYWSTTTNPAGRVSRIPLAGGPVEVLVSDAINPSELIVADGNLYYAHQTGISVVDATGSGPPQVLVDGVSPGNLAFDGDFLYWRGQRVTDGPREILRVPITGGAPVSLAVPNGGAGLAVDDTYAYYVEEPDGFDGDDNIMWRVDKTGTGAPVRLFENLPNTISIVPHNGALYFNSTDTIFKAQL